MTDPRPVKKASSILERAADIFGTDPLANAPTIDITGLPPERAKPARRAKAAPVVDVPVVETPTVSISAGPVGVPMSPAKELARAAPAIRPGRQGSIDTARLAERGMIVPGSAVTGIAEEYRIVKRELIRNMIGGPGRPVIPRGHRLLIASANPGEGKTFCAVNLALSLAAEADHDVLLIDGDIAKPSVIKLLGLEDGPGLMDALADPHLPLSDCIIQTDLPRLKVMPAGQSTHGDTEMLASARTETLLAALEAGAPGRILVIDSPPILAASPATVLAGHVGQLIMVVRADETREAALRDAVGLVGACPHIQLLLNGVKFSASGRRFGTYYGQGGAE
jgi:exopolysaccharide/PEP-CTERM locus tyrosine autokinase